MMATTSFTQLNVWKKAHQNVLAVYRMTKAFPEDEKYGLTSQLRRAAVSIAANIAEGYGRRRPADKVRFYNISQGSLEEMKYYLILAKDLEYVREIDGPWNTAEEVSRMLRRLSKVILP